MNVVRILVPMLAFLLPACQEVIIVHESSLTREFAQMNKNGWQVTRSDQPERTPAAAQEDPNVRIIRGADFSGYQFNTNFQISDPNYPQTQPQVPLPGTPSDAPSSSPYGPAPQIPGF